MQLHHQDYVWHFVFGAQIKSTFVAQYSQEHFIHHLINPENSAFKGAQRKNLIIEGSVSLLKAVEKLKSEITVVFVGDKLSDEEIQIKEQYESIGRAIWIHEMTYSAFRKALYPNLIFIYGPKDQQNSFILNFDLSWIDYKIMQGEFTANQIIKNMNRSHNYVISKLIADVNQINILQNYFNFKVIHLKHQRIDFIGKDQYFDKQAIILQHFKDNPFFCSIQGTQDMKQIDLQIRNIISPQIVYFHVDSNEDKMIFKKYLRQTNSVCLDRSTIETLWGRMPVANKNANKPATILPIIFRHITQKQLFISGFDWKKKDFVYIDKYAAPIKLYADCRSLNTINFDIEETGTERYLEQQKRRRIEIQYPLSKQLQNTIKYYVVTGQSCVGKTSASKYIAAEYGYKLIQYDSYVASIKEKLISPEDGEELPMSKIAKHFATLITAKTCLLIDGFSIDTKDVQKWTSVVGSPIIINLKAEEKQIIRRTRRKNEGDLNAEISEEETTKVKQGFDKNANWIEQWSLKSPETTIYQVDFSQQLLLAEKLLDSILKPRVYLFANSNIRPYLEINLALKYDLAYFNYDTYSLNEIAEYVKQNTYQDILITNFRIKDERPVADHLYFIQKAIGIIKYYGILTTAGKTVESHQTKDKFMVLQKPQIIQKPKPVEGEQGDGGAVEEQGEVKKKQFNIYEYDWSEGGESKNVSQWIFKLKKNIEERRTQGENAYFKFQSVLHGQKKDRCIYEVIIV